MPVRRKISEPFGIYFITFTCARWLSLFSITNSYHVVYNWFDYLKSQGHYIVGYAIMPNHVHAIIGFVNTGKSRNKNHEVFEPSFDHKECISVEFTEQKLHYVHLNPCRWNPPLVIQPEDYKHSSAKYYIAGEQGVYPVCNYMVLQDMDLTKRRR